jgi:cyclopropane-fatty-acyl-phospholipid synthase
MSLRSLAVLARAASSAAVLAERGWLPDAAVRAGIRHNLAVRLAREAQLARPAGEAALDARPARRRAFARERSEGPIAIDTVAANAQHYEVPTEFYRHVLGPHMKYSAAWWDPDTRTLEAAEAAMLALSAERAALADGQRVLDLGCGWGSLSFWIAARWRASRVLAVSNSRSQKAWIDQEAARRGLTNLEVVTADMNTFDPGATFDRIVSVEMFEHMRNWRRLLANVAGWLAPGGRLFLHVFTHRDYAYAYEAADASDWMARHFFSGGIMPSDDLIDEFADLLEVEARWHVNGGHYARTADAWLNNLDGARGEVWPILERTYGRRGARRWFGRWRMFFMACSELWGWAGGTEWIVSHYRLRRPGG